MLNYVITSYIGVGELKFGMTRSDIHHLLGTPILSRKSRYSEEVKDYWEGNALQLTFSDSIDELIEISLHQRLKETQFRGIKLFEEPGRKVMNALTKLDDSLIEEVGIYTFPALGLAVTGFLDDDDVKSVTAFKSGSQEFRLPPTE